MNKKRVCVFASSSNFLDDKYYEDVLIDTNEALAKMTPETLLVVVDTHKNDYVESQEILEKGSKIVLIDHHRRSAEFISDPTLTFH